MAFLYETGTPRIIKDTETGFTYEKIDWELESIFDYEESVDLRTKSGRFLAFADITQEGVSVSPREGIIIEVEKQKKRFLTGEAEEFEASKEIILIDRDNQGVRLRKAPDLQRRNHPKRHP